ncbi:MAG: TRAP transporter small permease [Synergistaceae bacterium]|jgi:TRAP-type C4-dicarboxylate transport system permease small subunit|nr:TRAP transporter small permease [Synergistaceae bacterium]
MEQIERILGKIDVLFKWLTVVLLGGMTLLIFIQVIFRYVLTQPLAWSEELARFLFIWVTFIAGYVGVRQNKHIGISALQDALPLMCGKILKSLSNLICTVFFIVVVYYTCISWPKLYMQKSPALNIPIAFVYLCMIIGSAFTAIWYCCLAVRVFRDDGAAGKIEVDNA